MIDFATSKMKDYLKDSTTLNHYEINQMFEYKESFAEQTTKKLNQQSYLNQERSMETKYNMLSLDDNPPQIGVKRPIRSEFSLIGEGSDFREE